MTTPRPDLAIWAATVNAALLGTDRTPLAVPSSDDALGSASAMLTRDQDDSAASLLRIASAASVYRRCGWIPRRSEEPPPAACPPDIRPPAPATAGALLRRILQGEHEPLLATWLSHATRHGVRAPADTLCDLLELGRREPALRSMILAAGGTRATWLAAANPDWSYASAGESADSLVTTWETGAGPARLVALQQLRALDAERARAMLESSWAQESPAERGGFVAALARGLSPADEPFLERALDDRRKEVRQGAAGLLARLPTSALVARMTVRAREHMSLGKTGLLKRVRMDITLPAAADDALVRDGVEPKPPPGTGIGERAWWLGQIIAAVPPSSWTSAWSMEPVTLLRVAEGHEWREPLVAGWLIATERHRDAAWADALWENERIARVGAGWRAPSPEHVFTTVLPSDRVDGALRRSIGAGRDTLRSNHAVLNAILEWPHEWSDALARAVALRLQQYARDGMALAGEFGVRALLERSGHAVPVSAIVAFTSGWPEQSDVWPTWAPTIDALTSVLRFRNDLHLAFTEESVP
jgi:hypothetical protein